jgi:hypothetical protein
LIKVSGIPTLKVRVVKVEGPSTLPQELPIMSQTMLDEKDEEIKSLKVELENLRRAFDDLQSAKTMLAKEVHRLHQLSLEGSEMFAGMQVANGKGDSKGWQRTLKRDGLGEVPMLLPLPANFEGGEVVDIPPVIVIGDCIDVNGLKIRFEEPIGAGMSGKIIGGNILNGGTRGDEMVPVAIKATMKSGFAPFDKELFREARALRSLGQSGVAPKLLTVVETPLRFLTIMVCAISRARHARPKQCSGAVPHVPLEPGYLYPYQWWRQQPGLEHGCHSNSCEEIDASAQQTSLHQSSSPRFQTGECAN